MPRPCLSSIHDSSVSASPLRHNGRRTVLAALFLPLASPEPAPQLGQLYRYAYPIPQATAGDRKLPLATTSYHPRVGRHCRLSSPYRNPTVLTTYTYLYSTLIVAASMHERHCAPRPCPLRNVSTQAVAPRVVHKPPCQMFRPVERPSSRCCLSPGPDNLDSGRGHGRFR
jgi:hypothetical protein